MNTKNTKLGKYFLCLCSFLIITCGCTDQSEETDAGNPNTDAATGSDGDADGDADAAGDFDSGIDAGEECKQYVEDDKCMQTLKCWCE